MMSSLCPRCLEGSVWFLSVRLTVCSSFISAVLTKCPDTKLQQWGGVHLSYNSKLVAIWGSQGKNSTTSTVGSRENKCLDTRLFALCQPSPLFYQYGHHFYGMVIPKTGQVLIHQLRRQSPTGRPTDNPLQINSSTKPLFSGILEKSSCHLCYMHWRASSCLSYTRGSGQ